MTSTATDFRPSTGWLALALAAACLAPAQAQQVFRIVGPDGKVTFSDRPPAAGTTGTAAGAANTAAGGGAGAAGGLAALPFELRQIVGKYPVTLYTSDNCAPCASARSLLTTRGVPFAEKTVSTADDNQALRRISGEASLPFATIGSQQLKGFSDVEWTQYLNAAGYPPSSLLPASYRTPAAVPLVRATEAPAGAPSAAAAPATVVVRPTPRAVEPPVSNPPGIRF